MRSALCLILILLLAGCSSASSIQNQCGASTAPYLDEWNCIRNSMVQGKAGTISDMQRANYLSLGDSLADQVKTGNKTDSQAKADLAMELARINPSGSSGRDDSGPHLCNIGGGLLVCNDKL